jgi:hypothetical protein
MNTRKGKNKQKNNRHKKGEGQTFKQWTQEKGRSVHCLSVCSSPFLCPLLVCLSFPFLVFIVYLFALPLSCVHCLSVWDKQTNNGHKKREVQTDKQWTQERGRTNRLTMDTRKGKNKHPLFVCLSFPFLVLIVSLFVLPLSCVHCLSVCPSPFLCPLLVCLSFPFLVSIVCQRGRTNKQWTQERGRTNRQTMDTRKGKDKQTNNGHKKGEEHLSCVDC